jgi:hypothetical protein
LETKDGNESRIGRVKQRVTTRTKCEESHLPTEHRGTRRADTNGRHKERPARALWEQQTRPGGTGPSCTADIPKSKKGMTKNKE